VPRLGSSAATGVLCGITTRRDRYSAVMTQYVALLRGINVGGNNIIKMAEVRSCFEALGFGSVATYIQSGNVLFNASAGAPAV
jgi:hypothetical protein